MKVEQWSPKLGAKGMLQQAWFRVKDIPGDQRSVRTIAKVGGLVGKVMEIDEKTRFRADKLCESQNCLQGCAEGSQNN